MKSSKTPNMKKNSNYTHTMIDVGSIFVTQEFFFWKNTWYNDAMIKICPYNPKVQSLILSQFLAANEWRKNIGL